MIESGSTVTARGVRGVVEAPTYYLRGRRYRMRYAHRFGETRREFIEHEATDIEPPPVFVVGDRVKICGLRRGVVVGREHTDAGLRYRVECERERTSGVRVKSASLVPVHMLAELPKEDTS